MGKSKAKGTRPPASSRPSTFQLTDVITILGKRGSGKTTLSRKIQHAFPRQVIIDRLQEYAHERGEGVFHVETFDEYAQAVKATLGMQRFKIVFSFDIEATNHDKVFNEVLRVAYYRGSVALVVEEVHNFASTHYLPQWFREVLLTGRHRKLALIATSQRPAEIHKTLLSQSHHIFCGSLHEKHDVNYLATVMGDEALKLSSLRVGQFLHFQPGFGSHVISNGFDEP